MSVPGPSSQILDWVRVRVRVSVRVRVRVAVQELTVQELSGSRLSICQLFTRVQNGHQNDIVPLLHLLMSTFVVGRRCQDVGPGVCVITSGLL